jgi:hypothetical protein
MQASVFVELLKASWLAGESKFAGIASGLNALSQIDSQVAFNINLSLRSSAQAISPPRSSAASA